MTKSRDEHNPGRRKFLKGVGIAGAGAAIADHLRVETEAQEKQGATATLSGNVKITLDVNGAARDVQVEPRTTPLYGTRCPIISSPPSLVQSSFATPGRVARVRSCSTASLLTRVSCSQSTQWTERSPRSRASARRKVRTPCRLHLSNTTR